MNTNHPSHGGRILVAEDSYLLAEVIADYLRDLGMEPVGPVGHLQEACYLARERALDGAVLDIKLRDALCFPAASILLARGIPFVFISGYSDKGLIPLGSVGNQDSQGRFVVIQAMDGPTYFERCPMGTDGTAVPG